MKVHSWSGWAHVVLRAGLVGAASSVLGGGLGGCGDDAQTTGGGGSTSASTSDTTAATGGSTSSSSTGGMCDPGLTSDPWSPIGPPGGSMRNVAAIGDTVVVSTDYGLFRSADAGNTWSRVTPPTTQFFENLAKTPTEFFASVGYAIYRSTDGVSWTDATANLPTQLAGLNLIQLDGAVAVSDPSGTSPFYRWSTASQSWEDLQSPPAASSTIAATGTDVYVGSSTGDVYASHAGGAYQKLTGPAGAFIMSASGGALVLVDPSGHPFVSTNGGTTFTPASATPISLRLSPTPTGFVSAGVQGVFTSSDFGASWQAEALPVPMFTSFETANATSSNIFAVGSLGAFARPVAGTWSMLPLGVHGVRALAGDGTNLVTFADGRDYRSTDGGKTWTNVGPITYASALQTSAGSFLAGGAKAAIDRSTDGGQTWTPTATPPLPMTSATALGCNAFTATPTSLLAATGDRSSALPRVGAGVYRSTDDGLTWSGSSAGLPVDGQDPNDVPYYEAVTALASGPGLVVAGTASKGIFSSADDGASWAPINTGIPADAMGRLPEVLALAVSANGVIAATRVGSGPTTSSQLWRSTDQGATWTEITTALPTGARVGALAAKGHFVFAGSGLEGFFAQPVDGVYTSSDDGGTWSASNDGLVRTRASAFLLTPEELFVGTSDHSILGRALCPIP